MNVSDTVIKKQTKHKLNESLDKMAELSLLGTLFYCLCLKIPIVFCVYILLLKISSLFATNVFHEK